MMQLIINVYCFQSLYVRLHQIKTIFKKKKKNYHTELLFVGGAVDSIPIASIWKFSYPKFMWTKIGDLIYPNNQQTCFVVFGFSC